MAIWGWRYGDGGTGMGTPGWGHRDGDTGMLPLQSVQRMHHTGTRAQVIPMHSSRLGKGPALRQTLPGDKSYMGPGPARGQVLYGDGSCLGLGPAWGWVLHGMDPGWGRVLYGVRSCLGMDPPWGQVLLGVGSCMGIDPAWGRALLWVGSCLGSGPAWLHAPTDPQIRSCSPKSARHAYLPQPCSHARAPPACTTTAPYPPTPPLLHPHDPSHSPPTSPSPITCTDRTSLYPAGTAGAAARHGARSTAPMPAPTAARRSAAEPWGGHCPL